MKWRLRGIRARLLESALFDSKLLGYVAARAQLFMAGLDRLRGRALGSWLLMFRVHRAALSTSADHSVERRILAAKGSGEFGRVVEQFLLTVRPEARLKGMFDDPASLLGPHATILKAWSPGERGVLLLNYSYVYAPFARLFDVDRIAERYFLVLEPSWSGSCDENILAYSQVGTAVFVQSSEPRDREFLKRFGAPFVPVRTAANWRVDHELFCPRPEINVDADVVMVAAWARFKRHDAVFSALAGLRRKGRKLKMLLAGYPSDMTREDIESLARIHGVDDQIEIHEWLDPPQVSRLMNRARVNLLWSRREGFNRAVIEGMFCGLPVIMRKGFNYGYQHDYINPATGRYVDEGDLGEALVSMVDSHASYRPREWVLANMTYNHATGILEGAIQEESRRRGERWSGGLVGHVSALHGNRYLEPGVEDRFADDYTFLRDCIRKS